MPPTEGVNLVLSKEPSYKMMGEIGTILLPTRSFSFVLHVRSGGDRVRFRRHDPYPLTWNSNHIRTPIPFTLTVSGS